MKVGVVLLLGEDEKLGRLPSYVEVREMARQAEAAGFDSVWLYDHLLYRFPDRPSTGVWEGWTFLAALAEATERCELRTRGPRQGIPILVAAKGPRMLQLTARYADSWNTAWFGHPSALVAERRADLEAACRAVGRDPATLEVTVGVSVAYPDLGDTPDGIDNHERFLTGPAEEVAAGLRAYEEAGVGHVICACFPNKAGAIARLGEALNAYRQA